MMFQVQAQQILDRRLSITVKQIKIQEALAEIQKITGVKFVYSPAIVPVQEEISIEAENKSLHEVLTEILTPHAIKYDIVEGRILLYMDPQVPNKNPREKLNAENWAHQVVNGVVKNMAGETLPGVSILIKGTTSGTRTDAAGAYQVKAESGAVLVFSFIGFKTQEFPVESRSTIIIELEPDIATLGEVIVTGYNEIDKESFTGSTIKVSESDIRRVNPVNMLQSLQTFDPSFRVLRNNNFGSNPNRLPEINVRGTTALPVTGADQLDRNNLRSNPNLPTFILDGFQVSLQTVYDLDVSRVESVTFLKDAAATAIYGSRAANGVLVINTKMPEEGKLKLSYNCNLSVTAPDLSEYNLLNASEKLDYEYLAGMYDANNAYNNGLSQYTLDEMYYSKMKNIVSGADTYWLAEPVQTAVDHNHTLGISGGSATIRYRLNARYQTVNGVMKGSGRDRYGADVNLIYQPNDLFTFQNTISVMGVKSQESSYGDFADYVRMNPYYRKRDEQGNVIRELDTWQHFDNGLHYYTVLNPLHDAGLSSFDKSKYSLFIDEFATDWMIAPEWRVKALISYQQHQSTNDLFKSPLRNEYYFLPAGTIGRGEYRYLKSNESTLDGNVVITYNKTIGRHLINTAVGANLRAVDVDAKGFTAVGFADDRLDNIGLANSFRENDSPEGSVYQDRLAGTFMSVNYAFSNKYLFDFVGRIDGSSKFGTADRTAPFWSAGIGWNLHNEAALNLPSQITSLRISGTTGWTGEVSFPPYMTKTTFAYYHDPYSTGTGASPIAYGNENLQWQRTKNYDVRLEVAAFHNRVTFVGRYYYKLTDNLVTDIMVPPSTGFPSYKDNLGELENRGFEIQTRIDVVRKNNWNVSLSANLSGNRNRIKRISESLRKYNDEADANQGTLPRSRYKEGQPVDAIYAVRSMGIDPESGREIYIKKDGTLTFEHSVKDLVVVGKTSPDIDGFINPVLRYKGVSLEAQFYMSLGGQIFNQTLVDKVENADVRFNVDHRVLYQRWKKPGDVALFKDIADRSPTWITSRFVMDNDIFELYALNLWYETPEPIVSRFHMNTLRLGLTMNNVWQWSTVAMERGIQYPFARTITLSLNAVF